MTTDRSLAGRLFWAGHANPGSVWTLIAAFPVLVLGVYRRDRRLLVAVALFAGLNPLVFPPPEDDSAWATRVVRGEQAWLDRGLASSPGDLLVLALGAPVVLFTLRAALRGRPARTALGTVASLCAMGLFFRRMARLYEREAGG